MIVIHDRTSAVAALARELPPDVRAALEAELALLTAGEHDLTDWTDILIVEPGDTEGVIARDAGFSPLDDPLTGLRAGDPGFKPGWDLLGAWGGVHRVVFTFGSTHATVLLVPDVPGVPPELLDTIRRNRPA